MNSSDQNLFSTIPAVHQQQPIRVRYCNWRGEIAVRTIIPIKLYIGSTEYHPDEQWLLELWDCDRNSIRTYALKDIQQWFVE